MKKPSKFSAKHTAATVLGLAILAFSARAQTGRDTTPPELPDLEDVTTFTSSDGAHVHFDAVNVTDDTREHVLLSYLPESGSFFPIGSTPVIARATDAAGNVAERRFIVHVKLAQAEVRRRAGNLQIDGPTGWGVMASDSLDGGWSPLGAIDVPLEVPVPDPGDPLPPEKQKFFKLAPPDLQTGFDFNKPETGENIRYVSTGLKTNWKAIKLVNEIKWLEQTGPLNHNQDDLDEAGSKVILEDGDENRWSAGAKLPFPFYFYGKGFTEFCVTRTGLLTFDTSVAGKLHTDTPNDITDSGGALLYRAPNPLPNPELPDYTIAGYQGLQGAPVLDQRVIGWVEGKAPYRQVWIVFATDWILGGNGSPLFPADFHRRNAIVLEESSNRVFIVDMMQSYDLPNQYVVGVQRDASMAVNARSNTMAAPNFRVRPIPMVDANKSDYRDNDYWLFQPFTSRVMKVGKSVVALDNVTDLDEQMSDFIEGRNLPGMSVAIGLGGRMIYDKSFGFADVEDKVKLQPWHRMCIGSTSKLFTAVGLFKMVDLGLISLSDLDDPVFAEGGLLANDNLTKAISDGVKKGTHTEKDQSILETITLRHLVSHTSSLPSTGDDLAAAEAYHDGNYNATDLESGLRWFMENRSRIKISGTETKPLPGAVYSYSNSGMGLVGRAIELATGDSYPQFIYDNVQIPLKILGMNTARVPKSANTYIDTDRYEFYEGGRIHPPSKFVGIPGPINYDYTKLYGPAGGWVGTARDLLRFAFGFDGMPNHPDLLPASLRDAMFTRPFPGATTIGLNPTQPPMHGWQFNPNQELIWHNGSLPQGGSSYLGIWINDGVIDGRLNFNENTIVVSLVSNSRAAGAMGGLASSTATTVDGVKDKIAYWQDLMD
ncbi:MAG: serine hydrolase [Verrucomicrobiae bacterium]|nr:serine hydrolase [Verrucomicrobiae bacterium]